MAIPNILIKTNLQRVVNTTGSKTIAYVDAGGDLDLDTSKDIAFLKNVMGFRVEEIDLVNVSTPLVLEFEEVDLAVINIPINTTISDTTKELIIRLVNNSKHVEFFLQGPTFSFLTPQDVASPLEFVKGEITGPDETKISIDPKELYRVSVSYGYADIPNALEGISAAAIAAAITKQHIIQGTPHKAIAGIEPARNILDQLSIAADSKLTRAQKEQLQAAGYNVLYNKKGFGVLFVSQQSLLGKGVELPEGDSISDKDPLKKKGNATLHLYITQQLQEIGERLYFKPNNRKTWGEVKTAIGAILNDRHNAGEIKKDFKVLVGLGENMTNADIDAGQLNVDISYTPVGYIEAITFTLNVLLNDGEISVYTK